MEEENERVGEGKERTKRREKKKMREKGEKDDYNIFIMINIQIVID